MPDQNPRAGAATRRPSAPVPAAMPRMTLVERIDIPPTGQKHPAAIFPRGFRKFRNQLIHGDHTCALRALKDRFEGAADLVYVELPGAPAPSSAPCPEKLHEQLALARELMSDCSTIHARCAARMAGMVRYVMDAVFDQRRRIGEINWTPQDVVLSYDKTGVRIFNAHIDADAGANDGGLGLTGDFGGLLEMNTSDGSLVAAFFSGNSPAIAAAEKLGRRWLAVDNSRRAIQSARTRIIREQMRQREPGMPFHAFDILECRNAT